MSGWTDIEIDKIRDLAGKGFSAAQVAADLPGRSRNAVIGKSDRIGVHFNSQPARSYVPRGQHPAKVAKVQPKVVKAQPQSFEPKISVSERQRTDTIMLLFKTEGKKLLLDCNSKECKFPLGGEPRRPLACGDPIFAGSYCGPHWRLAHR